MKKLKRNILTLIILLIFSLICITSMFTDADALDRCQDYVTDVRIQHCKYFGLSFPWWNGVGQLRTESLCRSVTAFDGGRGPAQFMPRTWQEVESDMGVKLDPYNPEHSIRAQAFYMKKLHKQNWDGALWLTYQAYNGGWKLLKREAERAGYTDHELMYIVCDRRVLKLKSGRLLDLCDVNYDYSQKVHKYGQRYRISQDMWRFW